MAIGAVIAAATAVLVVALAPAAIIRLVAIIIMDSLVVDHLAAAAVTSVHWRVVVLLVLFNHGNVSIAARVRVSMINDVPLSRWHHHQRRWSTWPVASIHHAMLDAH